MNAMLCVRTFLSELYAWQWVGILVARVAVGMLFFLSGRGKLFVPERREQTRQTLIAAHVPFPELNAVLVSTVEFVFGLLLIFGAITPLACAMLSGVMIMAIATTAIKSIKAPLLLGRLSEFLYLPEVLCLVILAWLFLSGPGWFSVDHLILSRIRLQRAAVTDDNDRGSHSRELRQVLLIQRMPLYWGVDRFPSSMRFGLVG